MNKIKLLTITLLCVFSMNCISTMCSSNRCGVYTQAKIEYKSTTPGCGSRVCPPYCGVRHIHCDGKLYMNGVLQDTKLEASTTVNVNTSTRNTTNNQSEEKEDE